jgi:lysozyme
MNPYIEAHLVRDEGVRLFVYDDATGKPLKSGDTINGYPTIGVGRNLTGRGITAEECGYLLRNDIAAVDAECRREFPWFGALDEVREAVVLNMVFNLGLAKFKGFVNTIADISAGNYESAASRMLQSLWARQVGNRALRLAEMMRTGVA